MPDLPPTNSETVTAGGPDDSGARGGEHGHAGALIGPYRLLEKIGEGGMGEVWLAGQVEPIRRRVALKIIKRGMDTRQIVARFEAERQALALMDHPAIAKVLDAGETPEGRPYFVMEHVDGVPITEHCDRHRLTNRERLALFVQVCEGVQHAHQKAVIHRDLKPSNVLVTLQDGKPVPKIIDFGVAKAIDHHLTEKTLFTEFGAMVGTPEYMSPEQAEMTGQGIDTRTDVYALGVMLYELLVGALPFDPRELRSAGFEGIVRKIREEEPPKPSARLNKLGEQSGESAKLRGVDFRTLQSQVRGDLDWITMKALDKESARRYGSPAELAADVLRYMAHEPVLAGPPSAAYRARKFARRHRIAVSTAAATFVVLVGFAATMAVQARRIAAERDAADKVAEFLSNMLADARPQELGTALWTNLHDRVTDSRRRRGAPEAEIQAAITSFNELFAGVNSTDAVLQLLDEQILARAGKTIEQTPDLAPRIAGRLEDTLGRTYYELGLFGKAEQHAERAVEIGRKAVGERSPDTLSFSASLCRVYERQGRYADAETLGRETLATAERVLGREHRVTLAALTCLANANHRQGRLKVAEELFSELLDVQRRVLGAEHRNTLGAMINLANVRADAGRLDEAENLHRELLETYRRVLGREHPDTLASMYNLAASFEDRGRFDEAEALFREAIEIWQRIRGREHPDTLVATGALSAALMNRGRYDEAEKLNRETLDIQQAALGRNHPDSLQTMGMLANILEKRGGYAEAEQLLREVLEIRRQSLGPEHPNTLHAANDLGAIYFRQGRSSEAELLFRDALETRRRRLGPEHPDTLAALDNLALAMRAMPERFAEAEKLHMEALDARRRILGPEHPDTLVSMNNLAALRQVQGRYNDAATLHEEELKLRRRALGPDHPETLRSMGNLAMAYAWQGRYAEAEKLIRETLELRRQVLGRQHPLTLDAMRVLAAVLERLQEYEEAAVLHRETLDIRRLTLGPEHPQTLQAMNNVAGSYANLGRYDEAEQLIRETVEIQRRVAGPEHLETIASLNRLGYTCFQLGRYDEAEKHLLEVNEVRRRRLGPEHPATLGGIHDLALTYTAQRRYTDAEKLNLETLEVRRRTLGASHPDTLWSGYNLACISALRGDREQALARLRAVASAGFTEADHMAKNEDLASLRGDPAFDALVARVRENASKRK